MTKGTTLKFLKGAGAAGAMAVALTSLAATPAMADDDRRGSEARSERGGGNGNWRGNRGAPQQAQQPRPQMRAPQQQQGGGQRPDWASGSRAQGGGQNGGQNGGQPQAPRPDVQRPSQGNGGNAWRGQGQPSRTPDWARNLGNNRPGNDSDRNRPSDNQPGRPSWQGGRDGPDRGSDGRPGSGPDRGPDGRPDRDRDGPNRWNDRDRDRAPVWKGGQDRRPDRDRRWSNDDHRWDRNDWRRDNRYDWRDYRDRHRSVYRARPYYAPYRGYSYRRLSIGFYMSSMFYGSSYWLDDPWMYRLPPVYGPYRWVRYYDDVLLVDTYSGEVVDVIYDFFW